MIFGKQMALEKKKVKSLKMEAAKMERGTRGTYVENKAARG
jgi:hypothetical protein